MDGIDWHFWILLATTVLINGLGLIMQRKQVALAEAQVMATKKKPAPKIHWFVKYWPIIIMLVLTAISWIPHFFRDKPSGVQGVEPAIIGYGANTSYCAATVNTRGFIDDAGKYRVFLLCQAQDDTVDPLTNKKIAISKPFTISGASYNIEVPYDPNSEIARASVPGALITVVVVELPIGQDGSEVRDVSDVFKAGGKTFPFGSLYRIPAK